MEIQLMSQQTGSRYMKPEKGRDMQGNTHPDHASDQMSNQSHTNVQTGNIHRNKAKT